MTKFRNSRAFLFKKCILAAPLWLLFTLIASHTGAQGRWSAELQTGINIPVKEFANADLNTGFGFDANIGLRVMPHLFINTGWGWNRFSSDDTHLDYEETGYTFGARFVHPFKGSALNYFVGSSAIYKHIETEDEEGDVIYDTDHGWGWQAEAGLGIKLGEKTRLTPFIRYRSITRDIKSGDVTSSGDLQYLSGGVGISWSF
jgi:hypothetical protein